LMCLGAVLTFGRVHLALTVEGRDQRRHVSAVDARGPQEQTTDSHEPVAPAEREGSRLFARERTPEPDSEPSGATAASETAPTTPVKPRRRAGKAAAEEKQD
jgi:hypothetical protein